MNHVDTRTNLPIEFLWLELTKQCNLECVHCYSESSPTATESDLMAEDDYKRVLEQAFTMGCRQVQFIGGEPTLNKSLPELIRYAHGMGYEFIEVYTNLMHLPEALVELVVEKGVHIATSIYGATAAVHNTVTKNPTSFMRTMGNLKKLQKRGVPVRAGVVSMPQNEGHVLETVAYLEEQGIRAGIDRVRHFGRANASGEKQITELCGSCAGGTMRIGPDGQVSPCNMSAGWDVGSVLSESLEQVLAKGTLQAMRQEIHNKVVAPQQEQQVNALCAPEKNAPCFPYVQCCPNTQSCIPCAPKLCMPCQPKG